MNTNYKSFSAFRKETTQIKNLFFTIINQYESSLSPTLSANKINKGLTRLIAFSRSFSVSISKTFSKHETALSDLRTRLKSQNKDCSDYKMGLLIIDDLQNYQNYLLKTKKAERNHINPAIMKCRKRDRIINLYTNEQGKVFEVNFTVYDNDLGINYTVFTDGEDGEIFGARYFVATYVKFDDGVMIFPLDDDESEHVLSDIEEYHDIYDPLNYYDYY